jgi:hypothetical protein
MQAYARKRIPPAKTEPAKQTGVSGPLPDALNTSPAVVAQRRIDESLNRKSGKGLPPGLKSGIESLSGVPMDDVNVHYNSPKPAQLQARAYAQKKDIHLAAGEEKNLPHEAWHVVQQAQGRVRPTMQARGVDINDDDALEKEADVMGQRAASAGTDAHAPLQRVKRGGPAGVAQRQLTIDGSDVDEDKIRNKGAYKTKLNSVISEEARKAHLEPNNVRQELVKMANEDYDCEFDSKREAVVEAISRLTGVTDAEEEELFPAMGEVDTFDEFPDDEAWRLLMDGKHQESRGKFGFENEKGYMAAMMKSFAAMLAGLGQKLTSASYEELHDLAVGGVLARDKTPMEKGFRNSKKFAEGFGVDAETWSQSGYSELELKYRNRGPKGVKDPNYPGGHPVGGSLLYAPKNMVAPEMPQKVMRIRPMLRDGCIEVADAVLNVFYLQIAKAKTETAKLEAIARCAQDLDQLHLFADGNIRTIAFLVVNKLLIENNLDPVILHEPNIFDCKSVGELVAALRAGQRAFRSYKSAD